MDFDAVIFDLDGTLLDTLADIAHSGNAVLAKHGFATRPIDEYRNYVGDGLIRLFEQTVPPERCRPEFIAECAADFREVYADHWNIHTRRYDGVSEMLDALVARKLTLAVLSNKPDLFARRCVSEYLKAWPFSAVLGQRKPVPPKPDPTGAQEILKDLDIAPERTLYVGDTATDMRTAQNARMHGVGVSWGFRPIDELRANGARLVIDRPADLPAIVDGTLPFDH